MSITDRRPRVAHIDQPDQLARGRIHEEMVRADVVDNPPRPVADGYGLLTTEVPLGADAEGRR